MVSPWVDEASTLTHGDQRKLGMAILLGLDPEGSPRHPGDHFQYQSRKEPDHPSGGAQDTGQIYA